MQKLNAEIGPIETRKRRFSYAHSFFAHGPIQIHLICNFPDSTCQEEFKYLFLGSFVQTNVVLMSAG